MIVMKPNAVTIDGSVIDLSMAVGDVARELVDTYSSDVARDVTCGVFSGPLAMTPSTTVDRSSRLRYASGEYDSNEHASRFVLHMTECYWTT